MVLLFFLFLVSHPPTPPPAKVDYFTYFFPAIIQGGTDLFKTRKHLGFYPIESCFIKKVD